MPIPLGILAAAGFVAPSGGSYDLLSTTILTSNQASVTFASLAAYAADYQHLQIRAVFKQGDTGFGGGFIQFNGDASSNYSWHFLRGNGSSATSGGALNATRIETLLVRNNVSEIFMPAIYDILEPFATSKYTTLRGLLGAPNTAGTFLELMSGSWRNTASLTSITFTAPETLLTGSRFSLYGLRKV
jgi:hypothetical protein